MRFKATVFNSNTNELKTFDEALIENYNPSLFSTVAMADIRATKNQKERAKKSIDYGILD